MRTGLAIIFTICILLSVPICLFAYDGASDKQEELYLPHNATSVPNEYADSKPIWLAYPPALKNKIPEITCPDDIDGQTAGTLKGIFSVSSTKQVCFSQGNLQYRAATDEWRFAENQYEFVGSNNHFAARNYNNWIDLFAWGTSGWSGGVPCYQPWSNCNKPESYYISYNPDNSMTGLFAEADWGYHNAISNGGKLPHCWRVLTSNEVAYLLKFRTNAAMLHAIGTVNNVCGLILLPDKWTLPSGFSFTTNPINYKTNTYTIAEWKVMEQAGAVFLPAAEFVEYDSNDDAFYFRDAYDYGLYHTASTSNEYINCLFFSVSDITTKSCKRYDRYSVRLVQEAKEQVITPHSIEEQITTDDICFTPFYTFMGDDYPIPSIEGANDMVKYILEYRDYDNCKTYLHHLNIAPFSNTTLIETACDNYTWYGRVYYESGTYTHTEINSFGCNDTITLQLTILPSYKTEFEEMIPYTWEGSLYDKPGDYTRTFPAKNGCDSVVTLHLIENNVKASITAGEYCADDSVFDFTINLTSGKITRTEFRFPSSRFPELQAAPDTIIIYDGNTISIPLPAVTRAGEYFIEAEFFYHDILVGYDKQPLILKYPSSVLEQNWSDFIAVLTPEYNGNYSFAEFQWYKNGEPIPGETHSYIYNIIEPGALYSVLLTDYLGIKIMSCELEAENKDDITAYPTLVKRREIIHINTSCRVTVSIYNTSGTLIGVTQSSSSQDDSFDIAAPSQSGIYIMQIESDNNTRRTIKIIVE